MDDPPAALFISNPTAYHLAVELREHPRIEIAVEDAARITGASRARARGALAALVEMGLLEPARRGYYRELLPPAPVGEKLPRYCTWCGATLTGQQRLFCCHPCAAHSHSRRRSEALAAERRANVRRCVVCGTALETKPRARHQLYCSRHCEYVAKGQ